MSLDSIVNVNITSATTTVSQTGFGTPLLFAYHTEWTNELVREYTSLSGMTTDGFVATDPAYQMAVHVFAQNPKPKSVKVGRRQNAPTQTFDLTPTDTTEGLIYTITIEAPDGTASEDFTYTVQAADTVADIIDGLVADMVGHSGAWTETDNTTKLTIASDVAGILFNYTGINRELTVEDVTADPGVAADLAAIVLEDDDWYCLLLDSNSEAEINAAATWTETQKKILLAQTRDDGGRDATITDDVISDQKDNSRGRTNITWHGESLGYLPCAWAGGVLPYVPGSIAWPYKTLANVTVDSLTETEKSVIAAENGSYYVTVAGVNVTIGGKVGDGEWLDVVRGLDWLESRIQENVFSALVNNNKIPYTDSGIAVIKGAIRQILQLGVTNGLLTADPAPTVTAPKAADVTTTDKSNRTLTVTFTATLAGAINTLTINGTVSV